MNLQTVVILVKTDNKFDKVVALNEELREDNFYGKLIIHYEAGVPQRVVVENSIKL